jgi:diguanylate cyclase (GGDEF)-like protein/PAS domain S-box-containing protein
MPVFSGLRARLLWLVLLAVLPAIALVLYTGHQSGKLAARQTVDEAQLLVRLAAADYERLVANTRQLLGTLAQLPEVRGRDAAACNTLFARLKSGYAQYVNLGVIGLDGMVFCSAVPSARRVSVSDRAYFQRALKTRGFAVGDFQIGRITHQAVVVFAHPDYDPAGKLRTMVFAALDLTWLNQIAAKAQLPAGSTVTLFDSQGAILSRYPDPEKWIGQSRRDAPLTRLILARRGAGTAEETGLDGVPRLYAFAPLLEGISGGGVYLSVGIPRAIAFAGINRILTHTFVGLALVTLLVLAAAWFGGDVFLLRKIRALVDATRRLGQGELETRTGLAHGRDEIGQLAGTFDEMATTLHARNTEFERVMEALGDSEERFRTLVETTSDWIWEVDARGVYTYASPKVRELLGYAPEEVIGKTPFDFMPPDEAAKVGRQFADIVAARGPFERLENVNLRKDGRRAVIETSGVPVFDHEGGLAGWRGIDRDITVRKQAEEAFHKTHELLENVFSSTHILIAYLDKDFNFIRVNRVYAEADGRPPEFFVGKNHFALYPNAEVEAIFRRVVETGIPYTTYARPFEYPEHPERGVTYWDWTVTPVRDHGEGVNSVVFSLVNVTERTLAQEKIRFLAYHDELTGLPNRTLLIDRLGQTVLEAGRRGRRVAVLCLDLDRFKIVNESLGHDTGNALIKNVAQRLLECVRPGDSVARLEGDEFAMVFADVAQPDDAYRVLHRIKERFALPITVDGHNLFVTLSIGVALYPLDGTDADALLRNAEAAMHQAKAHGGDTHRFYAAQMTAASAERLALENGLREALERGEFLLHYQPQVDLRSGHITGMEALVRWRHPERGMVPPATFIPLAEEIGLIVPIGEWVLRAACLQARAWQKENPGAIRVAVNLSPQQFREPGLGETVRRILNETGLDPRLLDIELTESVLAGNPDSVAGVLGELERLGSQISIDDFGTGYSSLSHLKRFPVDVLKIDQSFVRDCTADADDAAIVQAIITMAHALGIQTIAEGVETKEQLEFLHRNGCDAMQGYYFSRPVPAEEITRLLREKRRLDLEPLTK